MTDLRELLQRAAPVTPEFDGDALVETMDRRTRPRRLLAVAAVVAVVAVTAITAGALVGRRHRGPARPTIAVTPTSAATTPRPSTPMVTTPDGNQAVAAVRQLPPSALRSLSLPEYVDGYDAVVDGTTLWVLGRAGPLSSWSGISRIDLVSGAVRSLAVVPPAASERTAVTRVTVGAGGVFVLTNTYDGAPYHVIRLDPRTGKQEWTVPVPGTSVQGDPKARLEFGAGALWFSQGTHPVVEFSPVDGRVLASIPTPGYVEDNGDVDFAFGTRDVWVVGGASGTELMRIDPVTKRATTVHDFGPGFSQSLAAGNGYVWATHHTTRQALVRIDTARANHVTNVRIPTYDVAADGGAVWFLGFDPLDDTRKAGNHPGLVGNIDPGSGRITAVAELPVGALDSVGLVVHDGKAYVLDTTTHSLTIVDPAR